MESKITKADICNFFKEGGSILGDLASIIYGESLNQVGEQAFSDAIEIGIENTMATLYAAKVSDENILQVVMEYWGMNRKEAEDRLIWEKQQATIRSLRKYLKLEGYTELEITTFVKEYHANIKIRHNKELWKYKDNPKKLVELITTRKYDFGV